MSIFYMKTNYTDYIFLLMWCILLCLIVSNIGNGKHDNYSVFTSYIEKRLIGSFSLDSSYPSGAPMFILGSSAFSGVRVTWSLVLYIVLCPFGHCVVCPSSIYRFWLPFCYLKTLLPKKLIINPQNGMHHDYFF